MIKYTTLAWPGAKTSYTGSGQKFWLRAAPAPAPQHWHWDFGLEPDPHETDMDSEHCSYGTSVVDPDHFDADPAFHFDTGPDPTFHFDTDPNLDPHGFKEVM